LYLYSIYAKAKSGHPCRKALPELQRLAQGPPSSCILLRSKTKNKKGSVARKRKNIVTLDPED